MDADKCMLRVFNVLQTNNYYLVCWSIRPGVPVYHRKIVVCLKKLTDGFRLSCSRGKKKIHYLRFETLHRFITISSNVRSRSYVCLDVILII